MDLRAELDRLAWLDAGKVNPTGSSSDLRKAGANELAKALLELNNKNSDGPPLNIDINLNEDQLESIGGDYSTDLFGGKLDIGGKYILPSSDEDLFTGDEINIPGSTSINAGWKNKNIGLNVNYGAGGPTITSEFGASF